MKKFYIFTFFAFLNAAQEIVLSRRNTVIDEAVELCKNDKTVVVVVDIGDYDHHMQFKKLSTYVRHVRVTNNKHCVKVPDGFLSFCNHLRTIDLSALIDVTHIGDDVLTYCYNLPMLDLSAFSNVTHIGNGFASFSKRIEFIDLSPLGKIAYIGANFLAQQATVVAEGRRYWDNNCWSYNSLRQCVVGAHPNLQYVGANFLTNNQFLREITPAQDVFNGLSYIGLGFCDGTQVVISPKISEIMLISEEADCREQLEISAILDIEEVLI